MARCKGDLASALQGLEAQLLSSGVRKDAGRLMELLAEDFREFGSSGRVFTREQIVRALAEEGAKEIEMEGFAVERLADGCVLVTYRAYRHEVGATRRESLRSSIWIERDGRWQIMFHQGTKVG